MALIFPNSRAVAERLIEENGRALTLVRHDQGSPADPSKPWRASAGTADIELTVIGVFTEFEKEDVDDTLVRRGDKRVLVAATSVETEAGMLDDDIEDYDVLLDGVEEWKIVNVSVIEPGNFRVLYDIQVRK